MLSHKQNISSISLTTALFDLPSSNETNNANLKHFGEPARRRMQ